MKDLIQDSYFILYDIFLKIVSKPLIPIDNIKPDDFFNTNKQKSISPYKFEISRVCNMLTGINAKLRYISSGSTGHFFKGVILNDIHKPVNDKNNIKCYFGLKLTPYLKCSKYHTIYDINRPENTELNMLKCLSYFVMSGQTRHLILPVQSFFCPIHEFVKMMEFNKIIDSKQKYQKFIIDYKADKYENIVSVLISELASEGDFLNYIRINKDKIKPIHWKIFFFQLLSVLAVIQSRFPNFRHNDLKANNILLHKTKKICRNSYIINKKQYVTPPFNLLLKMWDFDFACIPGYVDNIKVHESWTKEINITTKQNRYYDIHFFFTTLQMFFPPITNPNYAGIETINFINDVVPEYYKSNKTTATEKGRLLVNVEYTTPLKLLETHPYFEEFRVK